MWTSSVRRLPSCAGSSAASTKASRVTAEPFLRARSARISNSTGVSERASRRVADFAALEVDLNGSNDQPFSSYEIWAAQTGLDARDELFGEKRLGHVVVGAELEPANLVRRVVSRTQNQNRNFGLHPVALEQVHPVGAGQHQVEDDDAVVVGVEVSRRVAVLYPLGVEPCLRKSLYHLLAKGDVIFHEQDSIGHRALQLVPVLRMMTLEALFHSLDLVLSLQQSKTLALLTAEVRIDLVLGRETKIFHGGELLFAARHVPDS